MQFISAEPLVGKFRSGTFEEAEVGPYFMLYMVLTAIAGALYVREVDAWDIASGIASIPITFLGLLYLKEKNGGTFGNQFLAKYFSLGWVVALRMLLIGIPAMIAVIAIATITGGDKAVAPASCLFFIAFEVAFYGWLGELIRRSQGMAPAVVADPVTDPPGAGGQPG